MMDIEATVDMLSAMLKTPIEYHGGGTYATVFAARLCDSGRCVSLGSALMDLDKRIPHDRAHVDARVSPKQVWVSVHSSKALGNAYVERILKNDRVAIRVRDLRGLFADEVEGIARNTTRAMRMCLDPHLRVTLRDHGGVRALDIFPLPLANFILGGRFLVSITEFIDGRTFGRLLCDKPCVDAVLRTALATWCLGLRHEDMTHVNFILPRSSDSMLAILIDHDTMGSLEPETVDLARRLAATEPLRAAIACLLTRKTGKDLGMDALHMQDLLGGYENAFSATPPTCMPRKRKRKEFVVINDDPPVQ